MPRREEIIVGLDIGTTKVAAIVGAVTGSDVEIIGLVMLFSPVVLRPLGLLLCSGSLIWISGLIALALSIVSLAKSVTWSLHHAIQRAERNRALATRQFEQQETLQPRVITDE